MSIRYLVFIAFISLLLTACGGGSSSNSSFSGTKEINGNTYSCTSENDFSQCTDFTSCATTSCTCNGTTCDVDPTAIVEGTCSSTSLNELADGESCTFNNMTYSCDDGLVSNNNNSALMFSSGTITINDFSVTCE